MAASASSPENEDSPRLPWETPQLQCLGNLQSSTRGALGPQLESGGGGASFEVLAS